MSKDLPTHWLSGLFTCAICGAKYNFAKTKRGNLQHEGRKSGCGNKLKSFQVELVEWLIDVEFRKWLLEQAETKELRVSDHYDFEKNLFRQYCKDRRKEINYRDLKIELNKETDQVKRSAIAREMEAIGSVFDSYEEMKNFMYVENSDESYKSRVSYLMDSDKRNVAPRHHIHIAKVHGDHLELCFLRSSSVRMSIRNNMDYEKEVVPEVENAQDMRDAINTRIEEFLNRKAR